jgi:hypothetical protein
MAMAIDADLEILDSYSRTVASVVDRVGPVVVSLTVGRSERAGRSECLELARESSTAPWGLRGIHRTQGSLFGLSPRIRCTLARRVMTHE